MDNRVRSSYKEWMNLCTGGGIEGGGDIAILQYTSRGIWQEVENNRTSDKKLFVTRSHKESWKIYGWIQYLSILQEQK